jgi:hypothetical protein
MMLSEALTKLKNLKSKAARTEKYIEEAAVYYEDQKPDYDYLAESARRGEINLEIIDLKSKIQETNARTYLDFKGERISVARLILINANLRSEMAFVTKQMAHSTSSAETSWGKGRSKDDVKKVLAVGCDKTLFRARLDELEREKEEVERVMADVNSSTKII